MKSENCWDLFQTWLSTYPFSEYMQARKFITIRETKADTHYGLAYPSMIIVDHSTTDWAWQSGHPEEELEYTTVACRYTFKGLGQSLPR